MGLSDPASALQILCRAGDSAAVELCWQVRYKPRKLARCPLPAARRCMGTSDCLHLHYEYSSHRTRLTLLLLTVACLITLASLGTRGSRITVIAQGSLDGAACHSPAL